MFIKLEDTFGATRLVNTEMISSMHEVNQQTRIWTNSDFSIIVNASIGEIEKLLPDVQTLETKPASDE